MKKIVSRLKENPKYSHDFRGRPDYRNKPHRMINKTSQGIQSRSTHHPRPSRTEPSFLPLPARGRPRRMTSVPITSWYTPISDQGSGGGDLPTAHTRRGADQAWSLPATRPSEGDLPTVRGHRARSLPATSLRGRPRRMTSVPITSWYTRISDHGSGGDLLAAHTRRGAHRAWSLPATRPSEGDLPTVCGHRARSLPATSTRGRPGQMTSVPITSRYTLISDQGSGGDPPAARTRRGTHRAWSLPATSPLRASMSWSNLWLSFGRGFLICT